MSDEEASTAGMILKYAAGAVIGLIIIAATITLLKKFGIV